VKELNEIKTKGTPPGILLYDAEAMDQWTFQISVLGDETIYAVCFRAV
jgi:ubiquitin-conjugating enzyme E2 W